MNTNMRAAWVAIATFGSGMVGFGLQWLLPAQAIADGKGAVGAVSGLIVLLLALVLGLVIWSSYGVFTTQVAETLSLGPIVLQLDLALEQLGPQGAKGRDILKSQALSHKARFWGDARALRSQASYAISKSDTKDMAEFFAGVRPATDEEKQALATARQLSGSMIQTQLLMARQLASPVPPFLIMVVLGWAMLLFASYGVLYTFSAVSVAAAALGSIAVASAVMLIFELSQPYDGNFRISQKGADQLIAAIGGSAESSPNPAPGPLT
jgi:hypothetical protein